MSKINVLTQQFSINGEIDFRETADGLTVVDISNKAATASIVLQGAHLTDWTPLGEKPVIWLSPDAKIAVDELIRGGIPVCWPWVGPHETEKEFPIHGYARNLVWDLISATPAVSGDATRLVFRLCESDQTSAMWPHDCSLELHYTIGKTLDIDLVTHNWSKDAVTISQALHTYFAVGDVQQVTISGLDSCPYLDKIDDFKRKTQAGDITIAGEVDRIYLQSSADVLVRDASMKRTIRIAKRGSDSTIIWNPWAEKAGQMGDFGRDGHLHTLCVETANAADDAVTVAPGGTCRMQVRYSVEKF